MSRYPQCGNTRTVLLICLYLALSVAHHASRRDLGAEIVHIRRPHGQISAALPLGVSDEFAGNDA